MALIETEGVILQTRPFSESSKILVIFTQQEGKVSLLVKGGRKGAKKFPGGLETLNRVSLSYYYKSTRDLQNFKAFDLIQSYAGFRQDLGRQFTVLSLAETVLRCTTDYDANNALYEDLTVALDALDLIPRQPWALRWKALLSFTNDLGFGITLEAAPQDGETRDIKGFDLENGRFIVHRADPNHSAVIQTTGEIWGILRFLSRCTYEAAVRIAVSAKIGRRIEALLLNHFRYHVPGLKRFESWRKLPEIYWPNEVSP